MPKNGFINYRDMMKLSRSAVVTAIAAGSFTPINGVTYWIDGLQYRGEEGSTECPGLPGLKALEPKSLKQYGASLDGISDDTAAVVAAFASGGVFFETSGGVARMDTLADVVGRIDANNGIEFRGSGLRFVFSHQETSSNFLIDIQDAGYISDCEMYWEATEGVANFAERALRLGAGSHAERMKFTSEVDQILTLSDSRNRCVWLDGAHASLKESVFTSVYAGVLVSRDAPYSVVEKNKFYNWTKGISVEHSTATATGANYSRIAYNTGYSRTPGDSQATGHNFINGSANYMEWLYNRCLAGSDGASSWEHGFYSAAPNNTSGEHDEANPMAIGCRFIGNYAEGTGRGGFKLRNHYKFTFSENTVLDAARNGSIGANEDAYRFESCQKGQGSDNKALRSDGSGDESSTNIGNYAFYSDSCRDIHFVGCYSDKPQTAVVNINDDRYQNKIAAVGDLESGYLPEDISFEFSGTMRDLAAKPLLEISCVAVPGSIEVKVGRVEEVLGYLVTSNITGGIARDISVSGSIVLGDGGSILNNISGGNLISVYTGRARYVGGSQRVRVLYASALGGGDGKDASSPETLTNLYSVAEAHFYEERAIDLDIIVAGEEVTSSRWNIDGWPFGDSVLRFIGADPVAGKAQTIIDVDGATGFIRSDERVSSYKRVYAENIIGKGNTGKFFDLKYHATLDLENVGVTGINGGLCNLRQGTLRVVGAAVGSEVTTDMLYRIVTVSDVDWSSIRPTQTAMAQGRDYKVATVVDADWTAITGDSSVSVGDIVSPSDKQDDISAYGTVYEQSVAGDLFEPTVEDLDISSLGTVAPLTEVSGYAETEIAIVAQFAYYLIGNDKLSGGEVNSRGLNFTGLGQAFQGSRGSTRGYITGNALTSGTALAHVNRLATMRTQANDILGPTSECLAGDNTSMWNNDDDYPDNFSGASETVPVWRDLVPNNHMGMNSAPPLGFTNFNGPQTSFSPVDPIWTGDINTGEDYAVAQVYNSDWSSIGGASNVSANNIFTATSDNDDIYNQGSRNSLGKAYLLADSVESGDVVQVAENSVDYSGVGGPVSSTRGEYFIATSTGSAGGYVYASHRAVKTTVIGKSYGIVDVSGSTDWSSVGGPGSASVGDVFTATDTDVSTLGAVVPMTMDIANPNDGGCLLMRLYRVPDWFWLPINTPKMSGQMSVEIGGTSNDVTLEHILGSVLMWTVSLTDYGSLDRWSVSWSVSGKALTQGKGSYTVKAWEHGTVDPVVSVGDTDGFNGTMTGKTGDFRAAELHATFSDMYGEFRVQNHSAWGNF